MGGDVLGPLPAVHWSQGRALVGALASHALPWALAEPQQMVGAMENPLKTCLWLPQPCTVLLKCFPKEYFEVREVPPLPGSWDTFWRGIRKSMRWELLILSGRDETPAWSRQRNV